MANSDFAWVNFDSDFTAANPVETRNFTVEGDPIGTGYLLVQARSLDAIGSERLVHALGLDPSPG